MIRDVKIVIRCGTCKRESRPTWNWFCPGCGTFFRVIVERRLQDWILGLARAV